MRKIKFQNNYYYHIYNRGVDKREIFCDQRDYFKFMINLNLFNNNSTKEERDYALRMALKKIKEEKNNKELGSGYPEPSSLLFFSSLAPVLSFVANLEKLVEIICYSLLPNHYHFILKQSVNSGIARFMHKLNLGHTNYFNAKNNRSGSLFQGAYKSISITSDSYLQYLSSYINGNPEIHKISKAEKWIWSSYQDYLGLRKGNLCRKEIVLKDFKNIKEYKELTNQAIKEAKQRKDDVKEYLLE